MNEPKKAPKDRFCDLVMKGGITSGVVYPRAVANLADHYRFHSIGGTSAGAIAAAITAAAEFRRRCSDGDLKGFDLLRAVPDELAQEVPQAGVRKLLSLFRAGKGTRRLFKVLTSALNSRNNLSRSGWVVFGLLGGYWPAALAGLVISALAMLSGAGLLGSLALAFSLPVLFIALWVILDIRNGFVPNGFGLCTGMSAAGEVEALTPWLHRLIQTAAGREVDGLPLTFGDLRAAPDSPAQLHGNSPGTTSGSRERPSINLKIYATNLSHGRPYVFPLEEQVCEPSRFSRCDRLYYRPAELEPYLPVRVLAWMNEHAPVNEYDHSMRVLPDSDDLPVLLAARLSLSFPLLMSAVPLYALNMQSDSTTPRFERCWFSDGGISSNFPMHLFDGLVPRWPTFGINLEPEIAGQPMVYLPTRYDEGYAERWNSLNENKSAFLRLQWFATAMISSMQNWNDTTLARMPGVRDRVARVRLRPGEGGMNLNMTPELIHELAARGELAVCQLLRQFAQAPAPDKQAQGWDDHRFIRLSTFLAMLEARAPGVAQALNEDILHASNFDEILQRYQDQRNQGMQPDTPGYESPLTDQQIDALKLMIEALRTYCERFTDEQYVSGFTAIPKPELRVRPMV